MPLISKNDQSKVGQRKGSFGARAGTRSLKTKLLMEFDGKKGSEGVVRPDASLHRSIKVYRLRNQRRRSR
jgi:hypothetical protein